MATLLPSSGDTLASKNHAKMHRIIAVDSSSPDQSITIDSGGRAILYGDPTIALHAATKQYVDNYHGDSGYSGYSGVGTSGYSGYIGISGYSGFSGYSGYSSYSGYSGTSGYSGYSGVNGLSGYSGYSGYIGISGYSGYSGVYGTNPMFRYNWSSTYTNSGAIYQDGSWFYINEVDAGSNLCSAVWSGIKAGDYLQILDRQGPDHSIYSVASNATLIANYYKFSFSQISVVGSFGEADPVSVVWVHSGTSGYSGYSGYSGVGTSGYSGVDGASGYSGYSGVDGSSGYSGYSGDATSGYSGKSGYSGRSGYSGISGYSGVAGPGATGGTGSAGPGSQYVTLDIGGTVYKLLHDGTI